MLLISTLRNRRRSKFAAQSEHQRAYILLHLQLVVGVIPPFFPPPYARIGLER